MKLTELNSLPHKPGVYLWKNTEGVILYVGKAKNLNKRIKQYVQGSINSYKTQRMMQQATDIDYIITKNEREALLLERNYIAKYMPEYNILLTDNKNYPYILIHLKKDALVIKLTYRAKQKAKNRIYYGPFPTGYGAKKMADLLNRIAVYEKGLPKRNALPEYWASQFDQIKKIISNKNSLTTSLKQKMNEASNNQKYEIASEIKEVLESLKFAKEKQGIEISDSKEIDAIAFVEHNGYLSYSQSFYRQGKLLSLKSGIIEIVLSKQETINQFIDQYYQNHPVPDLLLTNEKLETETSKWIVPNKGEKKQVINILKENALENIETKISDFLRNNEITIGAWKKLESKLNLKKLSTIEMIDNSNFANTNPVSAIVSYQNGNKNKAGYRKYHLENTSRNADVEYMRQAITKHFIDNKSNAPDLFIVDGGKAQVNEAKKIIPNIRVVGLVKNEKHITESMINLEGKKEKITDLDLLAFLRSMQAEVDRFAKSVYRKRATKSTLEGSLLKIGGVGAKTETKLINHFKSYAAIYNASISELSKVVSEKLATKIKEEISK